MSEGVAKVSQEEQWLVFKQGEFCFVTSRRDLAEAVVRVVDGRGFAASTVRVSGSLRDTMSANNCSGATIVDLDDAEVAREHFRTYYMGCDLEQELAAMGVIL